MKKVLKFSGSLLFLLASNYALACEACKLQQPKLTRNFTHGTGPNSQYDWIIVVIIAVIALLTLIFSLKFLIKPKEENLDHIKYSIFKNSSL